MNVHFKAVFYKSVTLQRRYIAKTNIVFEVLKFTVCHLWCKTKSLKAAFCIFSHLC